MSASTPSETPRDRRNRSDRLFWGLSVGFHGLLGVVLLAIPAREYLFRKETIKERARVNTSGDELERIVDQIRDRTADRIRARVSLLKSGQERMATNFDTMNKHHQPFESEQRKTAAARFETYADKVLESMNGLRLMLDEAHETKDASKIVAVNETVIPRIYSGQEEVRRSMLLLDLADADLKKKQAEAEKGQHEVGPFLRWTSGIAQSIERRTKEKRDFEKRIADWNVELGVKTKERDEAQRARDEAKKQVDATRSAERAEKDKNKRDELRKRLKDFEGQARNLEKKRHDAERRMGWLKGEIDKHQRKVDEHKAKLPEETKKRDELMQVAKNIQTGAYWKQKEIIDTIKTRIGKAPTESEKKNDGF